MSSCTTLTSFANMAAVSRGRLVISMLQRIGSARMAEATKANQDAFKMPTCMNLFWQHAFDF